jgi:hypothetical protein
VAADHLLFGAKMDLAAPQDAQHALVEGSEAVTGHLNDGDAGSTMEDAKTLHHEGANADVKEDNQGAASDSECDAESDASDNICSDDSAACAPAAFGSDCHRAHDRTGGRHATNCTC